MGRITERGFSSRIFIARLMRALMSFCRRASGKCMLPRQSTSIWSEKNRARALELVKLGEMRPAGLREIDRAKADGRWDRAYASASTAEVPNDLRAALARNKKAAAFFETLDSKNRYAVLHRTHTAKKAETRAARIAKFVAMLAKGETIHPHKAKAPKRAKT